MISDHSLPRKQASPICVAAGPAKPLPCSGSADPLVRREDRDERDLFRALSVYMSIYCVIVFINDHYFAGNPAFGPQYGTLVTLALRCSAASPWQPARLCRCAR